MSEKCWICEVNDADSGEHVIKKSVLKFIMGKPNKEQKRFISHHHGRKNVAVASFKNKNFKFKKSICKRCNDTVTQPHDDAFDIFVKNIFKRKASIINRRVVNIRSLCGNEEAKKNLSLYLMKLFGRLIVHHNERINTRDFEAVRESILRGVPQVTNVYMSMHRCLAKLSAKKGVLVAQYPHFDRGYISWIIDLDWISLVLSYPTFPPPKQYGESWHLGSNAFRFKIGTLE